MDKETQEYVMHIVIVVLLIVLLCYMFFSSKCEGFDNCTKAGNDPYASKKYIECCPGTSEELNTWYNDGRNFYKCISTGSNPKPEHDPSKSPTSVTPSTNKCSNVTCESSFVCDPSSGHCIKFDPKNGTASIKVKGVTHLDLSEGGDFNPDDVGGQIINNTRYHNHNVSFEGGKISLNVEGIESGHLSSGRVGSKHQYQFGVFVIRAIVPKCFNLFPAIWLTSQFEGPGGKQYDCYVEIDFMESPGDGTSAGSNLVLPSFHQSNGSNKCTWQDVMFTYKHEGKEYNIQDHVDCSPGNNHFDEHDYVMYWDKNTIMTWVDPTLADSGNGVLTITPRDDKSFTVRTINDSQVWQESMASVGKNPLDQPLGIVMNVACCAQGGSPDSRSVKSKMIISNAMYYPLNQ